MNNSNLTQGEIDGLFLKFRKEDVTFEDLDKVIEYYNSFKDEFNSKSNGKKMKTEPTRDEIDNIPDVRKKIVKTIELLDKKSKKSEEKKK